VKQVIADAKSIDVRTLDPSLPSQRLEDWLQSGPPQAHIRWTVADTCDNKPFRNEDFPLCAKVWFSLNGEAGSLLIQVGRLHKGIVGPPQLYNGIMAWEEDSFFIMTCDAQRLSDLPALLALPTSSWPVRKGPQEDGSFLVYVKLFAQTIDLGHGLKGAWGPPVASGESRRK
jgi:hypothetical protein